ncbi:MAG: substrate-binding domain-containing protein [Desulfobulbaceae bacterium]
MAAIFAGFLLVVAPHPAWAGEELLLATTTSTDNTGLLDYLAPLFTRDTGITLKWVATGTGKALRLGENCDADVLLVHAPEAEMEFVRKGFGVNRREVMYNDFVLIGPVEDPAGVAGLTAREALRRISGKGLPFVSRGDDSGTHRKERSLWQAALGRVPEDAAWYLQSGQGMLATITIAAERRGYTLTDRGTSIKYEANHGGDPPLVILVEGDAHLFNQYAVLEVNPKRCAGIHAAAARKFSGWITGPRGQKAIGDFHLLGKQLFIPDAAE